MDKIWLHNYPKNIPENIDKNSYSSIVDLINDADKKFKNNVFDMPTAENSMTGIGLGLSISGFKPILVHQRVEFSLLSSE